MTMYDFDTQAARDQDARAQGAVNAARPQLDTLAAVPPHLAALLLVRRAALAQIKGDPMLSAAGVATKAAAVNTVALAQFAKAQEEARQAKAAIESRLATARRVPGDVGAATLQELRSARIWERQRSLLAGGYTPNQLITLAADAGDLAALQVLRQELPTHLAATSPDDPHLVATVCEGLLARISQAETPLLPAGAAGAQALETELARGWYRLSIAFSYTEQELTHTALSGDYSCSWLPGWGTDETISVMEAMEMTRA